MSKHADVLAFLAVCAVVALMFGAGPAREEQAWRERDGEVEKLLESAHRAAVMVQHLQVAP